MALKIDTFSNQVGGFSFFKAVGHPLTAEGMDALLAGLATAGPVALYDPMGHLGTLAELHDLSALTICDVFVQAVERIGEDILGHIARPVTELASTKARTVLRCWWISRARQIRCRRRSTAISTTPAPIPCS